MHGVREAVSRFIELLRASRYVVAFTGAGISAESGIPTFRGRGGLWEKYDPAELATPQAFERDPVRVWEWYRMRMEVIYEAKPNSAHLVLARMERAGLLKAIITQNVDGLHQKAGASRIIELHGNIWRVRCTNPACGYKGALEKPPSIVPPRCPRCGSLLRPDVVWFGEPLPRHAWREAVEEAAKADLIIVVGTSGGVQPAASIPLITKSRGGRLVEVNPEETSYTGIADLYVASGAAEFFRVLGEALGML